MMDRKIRIVMKVWQKIKKTVNDIDDELLDDELLDDVTMKKILIPMMTMKKILTMRIMINLIRYSSGLVPEL